MRQPRIPVSPTEPDYQQYDPPPGPRNRPPETAERNGPTSPNEIAGWSAGHRKTVVIGWLLLVAAVFMGGQALGTRNLPQYDAGQSGQAERVLNQVSPAQYNGSPEKVLIQAKTPGATFATDPAMRQAASQVAAALAALPGYAGDIRTPLQPGGQAPGVQGRAQRPGHLPGSRQRHRCRQGGDGAASTRSPACRQATRTCGSPRPATRASAWRSTAR